MAEITVIIPNYNGVRFLKGCLEALNAQKDCPPYRVLVVDNGSGDGSIDLIRTSFPRTEIIALPENTGFCHAVNVGIRAAETPYVLLLNNDTRVCPGFLHNLYDAISSKPDAFSVSASMRLWDKPELLDGAGDQYCVLGWAYARGKGRPAAAYGHPGKVFSACAGAAIYRKSILDQIGCFDEAHFAYLEDLDIGYRARIEGYQNYYEPSAQVIHYGSASTGSRYNEWKTFQAAANNIYVIWKNMPLLQLLWNLPFLLFGFMVKFLFFYKKGMGGQYFKGLRAGINKSLSPIGRSRKVPFCRKNLGNYLYIQGQLYLNVLRILKKS